MKGVNLYARVRHAVMIEGISKRETGRQFSLDPRAADQFCSTSRCQRGILVYVHSVLP